jgi:hypothetical protein
MFATGTVVLSLALPARYTSLPDITDLPALVG